LILFAEECLDKDITGTQLSKPDGAMVKWGKEKTARGTAHIDPSGRNQHWLPSPEEGNEGGGGRKGVEKVSGVEKRTLLLWVRESVDQEGYES